jgi:hypothetical protein
MTIEDADKLAPIATSCIALLAAIVACVSIIIQRNTQHSLARKKSAIDFFLKTEMDKYMMEQYGFYMDGIKYLESRTPSDLYTKERKKYDAICVYLNIIELMASGIKYKAFDEKICRNFWLHMVVSASSECKTIIDYERVVTSPELFVELEWLAKKWKPHMSAAEKAADHRAPATPH